MRTNTLRLVALLGFTVAGTPVLADDWNVTRLRGEVMQQIDGNWEPLRRGAVVPDDRRIRTSNNGYMTMVRGNETLDLGPSTQIRIIDKGGAKPYTTVVQSWGTVAVEAEVRNVEHFAVQNQYLAAVVKGTRFIVSAGSSGGEVDVERGHVSVANPQGETVVAAGQQASVGQGGTMSVSGKGTLPAVVKPGATAEPAVTTASAASPTKADEIVDDALDALEAAEAAGDEAAIAKAEKDLAKAADEAAKAAEKAAKDAAKAAEKAARDQQKADEKAAKAAAKAAEDARKAAEKAARDAAKIGTGDDNSGKG